MHITIDTEALQWFHEDMRLKEGDYVRFHVRYGGCSTVQPGYSIGISTEHPQNAVATTTLEGVHFFIEDTDAWYFDNHSLHVAFDQAKKEIVFQYDK